MPTELRHWREWKEKCDLRICGDETKAALTEYIRTRWRAAVRYALFGLHGRYEDNHEIDFDTSWTFFESFYTEVGQRKVYKDGLFDAAQAVLIGPVEAALEKEMYNHICRAAAGYIKEYYPEERMGPRDDLTPAEEEKAEQIRREKLGIPPVESPSETAELSDLATQYFNKMGHRERVLAAARGLGLALTAHEVLVDARCKHAQLYEAHNKFKVWIQANLDADFPEKAKPLGFYRVLTNRCIKWAIEENNCLSMVRLYNEKRA